MPVARPLDLSRLRVFPLRERESLTSATAIRVPPESPPPPLEGEVSRRIDDAVDAIRHARHHGAQVILMYGAHLLRNGAVDLVYDLMRQGWITHLATNGAGTIHDWEYAWLGRSTEKVGTNVARGCFGTWDETGRYLHLAMMLGALDGLGYGCSIGRFIHDDGGLVPAAADLESWIRADPLDPRAGPWIDLLQTLRRGDLTAGPNPLEHRWKEASILARAWELGVPVTAHPGIGYDIIACHPWFNGSVIGHAAELDFRLFAGAVDQLDNGVLLSVGSAIMAPQVFEKSLSCVHNLRQGQGRPNVSGHSIFVVDLQDGGQWDWRTGEPPKDHPAYYLRFCKSFSRMGGTMHYLQSDNLAFVHHLWHRLQADPIPR